MKDRSSTKRSPGTRHWLLRIALAILILFLSWLSACEQNTIAVLTYNVGNLFDGVDDGTEYREYDPGRGVWNDGLFRKRLPLTASVIRRTAPGGPDIVFLQEIENENVLRELNALLGYGYVAVNRRQSADRRLSAVTVGILSRFPLSRVTVYELPDYRGEPVRVILEATVEAAGEKIVLFNNHWKSKSGGDKPTEKARLQASTLLLERVRAARTRAPGATVIMGGDFNERHDEYARVKGAYQTAFIRLTDNTPADFGAHSLFLAGRIEDGVVSGEKVVAFEPWIAHTGKPAGSYFYKEWETIDHLLVVPGVSAFRLKAFAVYSDPDLLTPRSGKPLRWDKRKPDRGYSDHLPIVLTFER